jgi:hypothetical protein
LNWGHFVPIRDNAPAVTSTPLLRVPMRRSHTSNRSSCSAYTVAPSTNPFQTSYLYPASRPSASHPPGHEESTAFSHAFQSIPSLLQIEQFSKSNLKSSLCAKSKVTYHRHNGGHAAAVHVRGCPQGRRAIPVGSIRPQGGDSGKLRKEEAQAQARRAACLIQPPSRVCLIYRPFTFHAN